MREKGFDAFVEDGALVARGAFTEAAAEKRRGSGLYTDAQLASMVDQSSRARLSLEAKAEAERARRALRNESSRQEQEVYASAYTAMTGMGGINHIQDVEIDSPSGEGRTSISAQKQINAVVAQKEAEFDGQHRLLMEEGKSGDEARAIVNLARIDWYAGNFVPNKEWQNTLNGIAGRATADTLLQKGEVSDYLRASADLYRQLKKVNSPYLDEVLTNKASKEFLEAYDLAVSRGVETDDALLYSANRAAMPEREKARSMLSIADSDKLAKKVLSRMGLDERQQNYAFAMEKVETLTRNGATEDEIKERLETEILDNTVPINGVLVSKYRDMPLDFPELLEDAITAQASAIEARYGLPKEDLYVVADKGGNQWSIWSKARGRPVSVPGEGPITGRTLQTHRETRQVARDKELKALVVAKDAERATAQKEYLEGLASLRDRVAYWRKRSESRDGPSLSGHIADYLEDQLHQRMSDDRSFFQRLIKDNVAKARGTPEDAKKAKGQMEFYKSILKSIDTYLPAYKIGPVEGGSWKIKD